MPVEDLRIGDRVLTVQGRLRQIRWIGRRKLDPARHLDPWAVLPVRIRADAFGPALPRRDLFLSPDHALYVQDVLIPVKYLIDGESISQTSRAGPITYFHVELESHDILLAEGLPAESYLDTDDRSTFDNGSGGMRLHRDLVELRWEVLGCAPLVVTGETVEATRRLLAKRARARAARGSRPTAARHGPRRVTSAAQRSFPPASAGPSRSP